MDKKILLVIMDGVGFSKTGIGDAVSEANTPTLDKLLAGELHDDPAVAGGGDEGVVLFRGNAGHGLEPVGVVRSTLFRCPVLHSLGDMICNAEFQCGAALNAVLPRGIDLRCQALLHGGFVEHVAAENFRNVQNFTHI